MSRTPVPQQKWQTFRPVTSQLSHGSLQDCKSSTSHSEADFATDQCSSRFDRTAVASRSGSCCTFGVTSLADDSSASSGKASHRSKQSSSEKTCEEVGWVVPISSSSSSSSSLISLSFFIPISVKITRRHLESDRIIGVDCNHWHPCDGMLGWNERAKGKDASTKIAEKRPGIAMISNFMVSRGQRILICIAVGGILHQ